MIKTILSSFGMAFQSIRSRFFHTILSVLGIIVGVAALVATLSLIDGMEEYANTMITQTTSLKAVMVESETHEQVNNIRVRKDSIAYLSYADSKSLEAAIAAPKQLYFKNRSNHIFKSEGSLSPLAAYRYHSNEVYRETEELTKGRFLSEGDLAEKRPVAVVNLAFAQLIDSVQTEAVIGKRILDQDSVAFEIIGILTPKEDDLPKVYLPISRLSSMALAQNPPRIIFEAEKVQDVPAIKEQTLAWLESRFGTQAKSFAVFDNGFRVKQANEGFLIFRVIMGMIVGLSVFVGGIGVMNVLLISVSERTSEIGIRKAIGASKGTIVTQFLSESIAVSIFGSFIGLLLGMALAMLAIPILKMIADVPFSVSFTANTMFLIAIISVLIGVVFGTYPALKASRLDPVVAIQRAP
ncbi:MAG: ABC transporter permease [Saprospiraceae bacterium]